MEDLNEKEERLGEKREGGIWRQRLAGRGVEKRVDMLEELEVRLAEPIKNVVDFREQSVGTELRSPSLEDGVGGGKDTVVDNKVVRGQAADKLLVLSVVQHKR